jgi:ubiquinone/menaquinone biosynthesis C-methylase UbiE
MSADVSNDPFDQKAATWDDDPAKVERAEAVARGIAAVVPLDRSMRMLEYGAGTGLVTQALRGAVGPVTLADTSQGMREVVHAKIEAGTLEDARVWDLDLAAGPPPDEVFDLVVTVMALHHIPTLDVVLHGFARLLAPGGHLCIVDLEEEDGSFHGEGFAGHHGFARSALADDLRAAGFTDVAFTDCHHVVRDGVRYPLFLATSLRPPDPTSEGTAA